MELKHFALQQSSVALTLLSMAECVTYVVASFLGDYLKDRLHYTALPLEARLQRGPQGPAGVREHRVVRLPGSDLHHLATHRHHLRHDSRRRHRYRGCTASL